MWKRIRGNFFTGLVVLLPAIITIWVLGFLFSKVNHLAMRLLPEALKQYFEKMHWAYVSWTIFVLLVGVGVFILVGVLARNIIGKKLISLGERILARIPLVNKIYLTVREISQAFLGQTRESFRRVVLLEYPRKGLYAIAFVTSESKGEIQGKTEKDMINVFLPTTPNPTSGLLIMVPEEDIIPLDMSIEEGMKLVISGGVLTPNTLKARGEEDK